LRDDIAARFHPYIVRQSSEGCETMIYLDNAATSHPKPEPVIKAVIDALTAYNANPGRSGHARALAAARIVLEARERLAALIGAEDPMSVIHCFNCTDALNLAIKGALRRGDHMITTMAEHNSVLRVVTELSDRGQITLTLLPTNAEGFVEPLEVEKALTAKTRLVALTQASNVTGALQPVREVGAICAKNGVLFLVDGAQALGEIPVDVKAIGCHLYAFPGHKGILGPQGTGGLYIRSGLTLNTIREGGTGASSDSMRQNPEGPERYESGTLNLPGIAGISAGAQFVAGKLDDIARHERNLTEHLLRGLTATPGAVVYGPKTAQARASLVSFNLADYASGVVADALDKMGFAVRGGLHCAPGAHRMQETLKRGAVRASVGHANTHDEIERFLSAVRKISLGGI
jgi:cysteine desulfurase family protein